MTNYERIFQELGELKGITNATLEQATKTNGRVTKLEGRMEKVDVKFAAEGGYQKGVSSTKAALIAVLTFILGSIAVPIFAAWIQNPK
jgi:hypothetical protein